MTSEQLDGKLADLIEKYPNSIFLQKVAPGNALYAKRSHRLCTRHHVNFLLDISDYPEWLLYFHSKIDSSLSILSFIDPGDIVLDIGGNIGQTALIIGHKVGKTGKVISFEPYPATIEKFERNLSLNDSISNVRLEKFGLGDRETKLLMHQDSVTNSGANRVVHQSLKEKTGVEEISIRTLDSYIKEKNISKIDLIKIDVEGFEMSVLKGGQQTLSEYKPDLFIELSTENLKDQETSGEELIKFLENIGYKIIDVATMRPLPPLGGSKVHTDIYCTITN